MKRLFTIFALLGSLLVSSTAFAELPSPDEFVKYYPEDTDHWAQETLEDFLQAGILKGYLDEDGIVTVKPDNSITRAEFVTLLVRAADLTSQAQGKSFDDVKPNDWFHSSIQVASSLGMINGVGENKFAPNQLITRAEISAIIVRAFESSVSFEGEAKSFADIFGHWAKNDIEKASKAAIVTGYAANQFKPDAKATRAEALTMISRALHKEISQLPDDSVFIDLLTKSNTETAEQMKAKQYDQILEDALQYFDGFEQDAAVWSINVFKSMAEEGFNIDINLSGEPSFTVLSKSNRFATVELKNLKEEVTISKDDFEQKQTVPLQDVYLFRKINGEWKIYGSQEGYEEFSYMIYE